MVIYYGLFGSISNYDVIAWGSTYKISLSPLKNIQEKILKIILNNHTRVPLNICQNYVLNSFTYNFYNLCNNFKKLNTFLHNKPIPLPRNKLVIGQKNYKYVSMLNFNKLPLLLKKTLVASNSKILKNWISINIKME